MRSLLGSPAARRSARPLLLLASLALVLSGCADTKDFGEGPLDKKLYEQGSPSPTPSEVVQVKQPKVSKKPVVQETKKQRYRPTYFRLTIQGGQCGIGACAFKPVRFAVAKGTIVIVKNEDSRPRTWTSDTGAFDSGPIAPGKTFRYTANKVGSFPFHDETARYVTGEMQVVAT